MRNHRPITVRPWMPTALLSAVGISALLFWPSPADRRVVPSAGHPAVGGVLTDLSSVTDAARLGDGWIIVDGREHTLHVTDSLGQLVRQIGRRGRGPGEFVSPTLVAVTASRMFVAQFGRPELSEFDLSGRFLRSVPAVASCGAAPLLVLAGASSELVGVRRCFEPPHRVRLQLERLIDGALQPWGPTDTIPLLPGGVVPITLPLLALDDRRVLVGDSDSGCLRTVNLVTSVISDRMCYSWLPRPPLTDSVRARTAQRSQGRVAFTDSLPRLWRIALHDSVLFANRVDDHTRSTWLRLPFPPIDRLSEPLGRPATEKSFLDRSTQLIVTEDDNGIHLEVIRVRS